MGGALVARVITRRGPVAVVVGGFEAVEAGCEFRLVAIFDGRRGRCETAADSWIAGSFLGRSWSSSPELTAFRFKLTIVGREEDEDRADDGKEIADGPTVTFSCSLGKRDILTFARLREEPLLGRIRTAFSHGHVTFVILSRAFTHDHVRGYPNTRA